MPQKQLNLRLSDEEIADLHKLAEERGMTIKELVKESLKRNHSIPEVELSDMRTMLEEEHRRLSDRLNEISEEKAKLAEEKPQLAKQKAPSERTYSWDAVSESVKSAIKEGSSWLGFNLERVAEALKELHLEWHNLPEAGKLAILGQYKVEAQTGEYGSDRIPRDLAMLAEHICPNCKGCKEDMMHFYHSIKLVKNEETDRWDASIIDSYQP